MKKNIIIIVVLLIFFGVFYLLLNHSFQKKNYVPHITIERMEHSITSTDGELLALIYFDKPLVSGNFKSILKVNKYFESVYEDWLNGKSNMINFYGGFSMNKFLDNLNSMRKVYGDDKFIIQPLEYYVDTEVVFLSEKLISFRHYVHFFSGGASDTYCFGNTFDVKTGEIVSFTDFYNVNAYSFKNSLVKFLIQYGIINGITGFYDIDNEFIYESNKHQWNMAYEYYYDGTSICLTLNQIGVHSGYIVKWNGKIDNEFEATIWKYGKENDLYYECQIYAYAKNISL